MPYVAREYGTLLGMKGFSDTLLRNHFTLYQGYVTNTNKTLDTLGAMLSEGKTGTAEYAEIKRRFGWEFNGMRLHELYFGNLGGEGTLDPGSRLGKALAAEFGSVEKWEADFRASGSMRGIGWVILYRDTAGKRFFNSWVNEHDMGHPAGASPILVLDVFEHAFMVDYGLKKGDYIQAFFRNIDWKATEARLA